MKNIEVIVKKGEKTLEINSSKVKLDESFVGAEISPLPKEVGEKVLELRYKENINDSLFDEFNKVYNFLEKEGLRKHLDAYPCPSGMEYPTIAITGNFNAYIS